MRTEADLKTSQGTHGETVKYAVDNGFHKKAFKLYLQLYKMGMTTPSKLADFMRAWELYSTVAGPNGKTLAEIAGLDLFESHEATVVDNTIDLAEASKRFEATKHKAPSAEEVFSDSPTAA